MENTEETEIKTEIQTESENDIKTTEETTTVGMFLKYTRVQQKKSIETVSEALCIRKIYITAIEEDDYETLAPVPYGTGFVRSYATYLGLNPDRVVQFYKKQYLPKIQPKKQIIVQQHTKRSIPTTRQIVLSLLGILLLYLIFLAAHLISEKKNDIAPIVEENTIIEVVPSPEDTEVSTDQSSEAQDETNQPLPATELNAEQASSQDNAQINVVTGNYVDETASKETFKKMVLKFKGESWLEVKDNDKVYISGTFNKGFEYTVPSEKGLILSVGKYFNVDIYVDDVLTKIATPQKQTGIALDPILKH